MIPPMRTPSPSQLHLPRVAARTATAACLASLLAAMVPAAAAQEAEAAPKVALAPLPEDRAEGAATIRTEDLRRWIETLASPEFGGRGTGTEGFARAAKLVAEHFEHLGLEPAGDDGGYLQVVPWTTIVPDPQQTSLRFTVGERTVLELRPDAGLNGNVSGDVSMDGGVVVLSVHDLQRARFDPEAIAEKLVLLTAPGGMREAVQRSRQGPFALFALQARLQQQGAASVVFVDDERHHEAGGLHGTSGPGPRANRAAGSRARMPATLYVTAAQLATLLEAAGAKLDAEVGEDRVVELSGMQAALRIQTEARQAPAYNVVGVLRGADPKLRDEYVVIGSHLDHLGTRQGKIHPGADDDGSGTAGVLALSRAFAENPGKPARSVLFVTFCGEETGLVGSSYFTRNPPIPLERIAAELQMDMIGRNEGDRADNADMVYAVGIERLSPDLQRLVLERNARHAGLRVRVENPQDVFTRSDHYNFARHGVPIAFFFTGFHPDYHQPTDTADKIEYDKLARIARFVYDVAFELARQPERPRVDPALWEALPRKGRAQPAAPLLGDER